MAKKKRKGFDRVKFELNLLSSITRLNFHCTELKEKLNDYMTVIGCDMLAEQRGSIAYNDANGGLVQQPFESL